MIRELKPPKPKSRSDIVKTLRDLLELAQKERIEYLDVCFKIENDHTEKTRTHIDGVFSTQWMYRD